MNAEVIAAVHKAGAFASPPTAYQDYEVILIYGAGNVGRDVFRILGARGIKAAGFLDRKAALQDRCSGVPVHSPDWDGLSAPQRRRTCVVVALHNGDVEILPIMDYLHDRGYGKIVSPVEFHYQFSDEMGDRFWLTSRSSYRAWEREICEGYTAWEDEHSRQLYLRFLEFRVGGNYADLPPIDADRQYFPVTVPPWKHPLRFVDGGAYDGDTLRSAAESQYEIEAAAVFEPDSVNCAKLREYVSSLGNKAIQVCPYGIYSTTDRLSFAAGGSPSSRSDENGDTKIQMVALDDFIPSFRPNLIKFDIEGAEYDGLLGAKRIIRENRPGLAICVYHRPQDMWRIPILVRSWGLGYSLFMRIHKNNGFDLVMYAMPPEQMAGAR
jgi:FkbM family methyltransferase